MTKRKINFIKRWDSKGNTYDQGVNITDKEWQKMQTKISSQRFKNKIDVKDKINIYSKLYLKVPYERISNIVFTNHTQRNFFTELLKIKIKDRNTYFIINNKNMNKKNYINKAQKLVDKLQEQCTTDTICENYGQDAIRIRKFIDKIEVDAEYQDLYCAEQHEIKSILYKVSSITPKNKI